LRNDAEGPVTAGRDTGEPNAVSLRVPFQAPSASLVRRELRRWLEGQNLKGETIDDARVVVSELVGNSVRHAAPLPVNEIAVTWGVDNGDLVISVSDGGGGTAPHPVSAPRSAISGRGLSIVAALVDRWWVETSSGQTTVHVRMGLGGPTG
jgi:anti-sigma regulatory factor (Ser/Thr protein kinase)